MEIPVRATSSDGNLFTPSSTTTDLYEIPFYLHTGDHAGLVLVSDRLTTASDFHSWRRSVGMALNVRNKVGFIDGTIPRPLATDRSYGAWSRCNDMVATWLMNSVSKKIGQSLLFISTAEGIWKNLLSRFKQDDAPRVYEIEQRLSKIEQGSLDVSGYYTELITLWEEHKNYIELPVCTCGKCECEAAALWEKLQHRSRVTKFLMGLNESYEQTRRHILMLKPIPSIEEAFNIVSQDERQKSVRPVTKVDAVAFNTNAHVQMEEQMQGYMTEENTYVDAYNTARPSFSKPVCTHCGKMGHNVTKCFKLHGYPPGYKTNAYGFRPPFQPRMQHNQVQPRMPMQMSSQPVSYQQANAVANVCYEGLGNSPYTYPQGVPHLTSGGANLNLQDFSPQQIQGLISQFNSQVQLQETVAPHSNRATISDHGVMAQISTSGTFSGIDDWEG